MLPKIAQPTFTLTIPSSKRAVRFRPYVTREEKILLMAQSGGSETEILNAVRDVVLACAQEPLMVEDLALFDLEYLFLRLTAVSVDNKATVTLKDNEDKKVREFVIELDKVPMVYDETNDSKKKVKVNDTITLTLKYPPATLSQSLKPTDSQTGMALTVVKTCIDKIFDGDTVYSMDEVDDAELSEFVDELPNHATKKIGEYFMSLPHLLHTIHYVNDMGTERTIKLTRLEDFFRLR